ncbi:hypothetical protein [Spirochaeta cellobiosiphila]|nr:hypothetical protein [Spirochaeta cellobiosiphila]
MAESHDEEQEVDVHTINESDYDLTEIKVNPKKKIIIVIDNEIGMISE